LFFFLFFKELHAFVYLSSPHNGKIKGERPASGEICHLSTWNPRNPKNTHINMLGDFKGVFL
jgi:hypothetical protein